MGDGIRNKGHLGADFQCAMSHLPNSVNPYNTNVVVPSALQTSTALECTLVALQSVPVCTYSLGWQFCSTSVHDTAKSWCHRALPVSYMFYAAKRSRSLSVYILPGALLVPKHTVLLAHGHHGRFWTVAYIRAPIGWGRVFGSTCLRSLQHEQCGLTRTSVLWQPTLDFHG